MRTVTDSKGRVTISVPADWDVFSLGANVLAGKMRKDVPEDLFSMIVAMAPRAPEHLPALTVVTTIQRILHVRSQLRAQPEL